MSETQPEDVLQDTVDNAYKWGFTTDIDTEADVARLAAQQGVLLRWPDAAT